MAAPKGNKFGKSRKGKPNKKTVSVIKSVEYVKGLLEETLQDDIKDLKPAERVKLWADLQEYLRPKLARTELTGKNEEAIQINFTPAQPKE